MISFLNQIKEFTSIQHIHNYGEDDAGRGGKTFADMFDADINKTAKELAKTFLVNNLLRGIYRTEVVNSENGEITDKEFAFVKIGRPQDGNSRINVTVGSKLSDKLSRVNVAVGNGIFAQLSINSNGDDEATVMDRADGVNYFKHNKVHNNFDPIPFKKGWLWGDNRSKILGSASTPIIKTTYLRKDRPNNGEMESQESISFRVKDGVIGGDGKLWGGDTRLTRLGYWDPTAAPMRIGPEKRIAIGENADIKLSGSELPGSEFSLRGFFCTTLLGKKLYTKSDSNAENVGEKSIVVTGKKFSTTFETEKGHVIQALLKKDLTSGWSSLVTDRVTLQDPKLIPNKPSPACSIHGKSHTNLKGEVDKSKSGASNAGVI